MKLNFDTLPLDLHFQIQSYLPVRDKIAVSQICTKLQTLYRTFSCKRCTVFQLEKDKVSSESYHTRSISMNILQDPESYSWFLAKEVCYIEFGRWFHLLRYNFDLSVNLILWLQSFDESTYYPRLKEIKFPEVKVEAWKEKTSSEFPNMPVSIYSRYKVSGIRLVIPSSMSDGSDHFVVTPLQFFGTICHSSILGAPLGHPPFKLLPNLKTIRIRDLPGIDFQITITAINLDCPNLRTLYTSHYIEKNSSDNTIYTDSAFPILVNVRKDIDIIIIIDDSIRLTDKKCISLDSPNVKEIQTFPEYNHTKDLITLISHAKFDNLKSIWGGRGVLEFLSDVSGLFSTTPHLLTSLNNLKILKFSYVNLTRDLVQSLPKAFSMLNSLVYLDVTTHTYMYSETNTIIGDEFLSMSVLIRNFVAKHISFISKEYIARVIDEVDKGDNLSYSQKRRLIDMIVNPLVYVPIDDRDLLGIDALLNDLAAFEFLIANTSRLTSLEYLKVSKLESASTQLQLLVDSTKTLKEVVFDSPLRINNNLSVLPIADHYYSSPLPKNDENSDLDEVLPIDFRWYLDLEPRRYAEGIPTKRIGGFQSMFLFSTPEEELLYSL